MARFTRNRVASHQGEARRLAAREVWCQGRNCSGCLTYWVRKANPSAGKVRTHIRIPKSVPAFGTEPRTNRARSGVKHGPAWLSMLSCRAPSMAALRTRSISTIQSSAAVSVLRAGSKSQLGRVMTGNGQSADGAPPRHMPSTILLGSRCSLCAVSRSASSAVRSAACQMTTRVCSHRAASLSDGGSSRIPSPSCQREK